MTDIRLEVASDGSQPTMLRLKTCVAAVLAAIRQNLAVRRDRSRLHALPDTLLKDIGINRGSIDHVSAWRRERRSNELGDSL